MTDEQPPIEYISYNGLGRSPMIWGVPYMTGLFIMSASLMAGLVFGTFVGRLGWFFALVGVPLLLFAKMLCINDDRAIRILLLETKWTLIKAMSGNAKYYGGTMTIAPTTYGRRLKHVRKYFEKAIRR